MRLSRRNSQKPFERGVNCLRETAKSNSSWAQETRKRNLNSSRQISQVTRTKYIPILWLQEWEELVKVLAIARGRSQLRRTCQGSRSSRTLLFKFSWEVITNDFILGDAGFILKMHRDLNLNQYWHHSVRGRGLPLPLHYYSNLKQFCWLVLQWG